MACIAGSRQIHGLDVFALCQVRVNTAHFTGTNGSPDSTTSYFTSTSSVRRMGGQFEVKDGATKKYYSIAGMMVAMNDGTGLQYLLTDHLGSTLAVTNQSGTLTSQQRYLPFGAARTIPNSPILGTDFTYTGQRKLDDGMGGIMDYKARFYSPALGRFLQPDTIIPDQSNPQSWNRLSYVTNNPVRFNDPTGHMMDEGDDGGCLLCEDDPIPPLPPSGGGGNGGGRGDVEDELDDEGDTCTTVLCRAEQGDVLAVLELLIPSHFGMSIPLSVSFGIPGAVFGLGAGFEVSANFIYYWRTDRLILTVDLGGIAGPGAKIPVPIDTSVTGGPILGWGQSTPDAGNISVGLGGNISAKVAVAASVSTPATISENGIDFYVDPVYGVNPATLYGGAGVGCCGAGVNVAVSTPIITLDMSEMLPWNWP